MVIRLFYYDKVVDLALPEAKAFSIGSSKSDDYTINDQYISEKHIVISGNGNGKYTAVGKAGILPDRKDVTEAELYPGLRLTVSSDGSIFMVVLGDGELRHTACLDSADSVTIGKAADNLISIKSRFVSRHHARIFRDGGNLYIEDLNSTNGIFVNGSLVKKCRLDSSSVIVIYDITIALSGTEVSISCGDSEIKIDEALQPRVRTGDEKVFFERSPRIKKNVPTKETVIEAPPAKKEKQEINWVSTLLPALITIGVAVLISTVSSNPTMMLYSLPMTLGGIAVSVYNYFKATRDQEKSDAEREETYCKYLVRVEQELESKQKAQRESLEEANPGIAEALKIATGLDRRLWARRPGDADFADVYVGRGNIDNSFAVTAPRKDIFADEDELIDKAMEVYNKYRKLENAPVTFKLHECRMCGIVGRKSDGIRLLNNMLIRLTLNHSHEELKLVFAGDTEDRDSLDYVCRLPHVMNQADEPCVAWTKADADELLAFFGDVLRQRGEADEGARRGLRDAGLQIPYYVFALTRPELLSNNSYISDCISRGGGNGAGIIVLANSIQQLPKECNLILELNGTEGKMYSKQDAGNVQRFCVDDIDYKSIERFSMALNRIDCAHGPAGFSMPKSYDLFSLLGIGSAEELDIGRMWKSSDITKSLAAPVGIGEDGRPVLLDISDGAHGPHGLLAGTTGSGKSEFLLSYIAGLAASYSPSDLGFLIIDFKGDGLGMQLKNLPHLLGSISNIDETAVERSLKSVKAELVRRQELFRAAKVNNISSYIAAYKNGRTEEPLPHLIIIVDEFAELKAQQPEFMKELISAARIGRSLGVHLILSTQKPAGQVDEQISSNSRFRICLKVQNPSDSNEVIGSPLAAQIREPGRGYLCVGNKEVFSLFQSGYGGVMTDTADIHSPTGEKATQLTAVINRIESYCAENSAAKLTSIVLPELPLSIALPVAAESEKDGGISVDAGIFDCPEHQRQGRYVINLTGRNVMIIGSAQTGKTNLAMSIVRSIAERYSPEEAEIYIVDFASMALKQLEGLNHVGGVVTPAEDEKLKNLMKMLFLEIEKRKKLFLEKGVGSFEAYLESGGRDLSQIVLIIENITALKELCFQDDAELIRLCRECAPMGISVVATNSQTAGISYKYFASFPTRIAFFNNNRAEYSTVFDGCRRLLPEIKGRCIVEIDKALYECQAFLAFDGKRDIDRAKEIQSFISRVNSACPDKNARAIPEVPDKLGYEDILKPCNASDFVFPMGMDYDTVMPFALDLKKCGPLALSGTSQQNQNAFVEYLVKGLELMYPGRTEVYVADGIERRLRRLEGLPNVKSYGIVPETIAAMLCAIEQTLAERYRQLAGGNNSVLDTAGLLVLVLNGIDAMEAVCTVPSALSAFRSIVSKYKSIGVLVVGADIENSSSQYSCPEPIKKICENRQYLYFDSLQNLKLVTLPMAVQRSFKKALENTDCYYIKEQECKKLKIPTV